MLRCPSCSQNRWPKTGFRISATRTGHEVSASFRMSQEYANSSSTKSQVDKLLPKRYTKGFRNEALTSLTCTPPCCQDAGNREVSGRCARACPPRRIRPIDARPLGAQGIVHRLGDRSGNALHGGDLLDTCGAQPFHRAKMAHERLLSSRAHALHLVKNRCSHGAIA